MAGKSTPAASGMATCKKERGERCHVQVSERRREAGWKEGRGEGGEGRKKGRRAHHIVGVGEEEVGNDAPEAPARGGTRA